MPRILHYGLLLLLFALEGCPPFATQELPPLPAYESYAQPLVLTLLSDETLSGPKNRTPELTMTQLEVVLDSLRRRGGELAVGFVSESSERTFTRVYVPAFRLPRPVFVPTGRPFEDAERRPEYKRHLAAYRADSLAHTEHVEKEFARFREDLSDALTAPPSARHTDLYGALRRAELVAAEHRPWAGADVRPTIVLVGDGLDDVGGKPPPVPLPSGGRIVVVNGTDVALQALAPYEPLGFESVEAALRSVLTVPSR